MTQPPYDFGPITPEDLQAMEYFRRQLRERQALKWALENGYVLREPRDVPDRALDMSCFIAEDFRPECGCPHEHWHVGGNCLDIHFEPDGSAHGVAMGEDWETETAVAADSIEDARAKIFAWYDATVNAS